MSYEFIVAGMVAWLSAVAPQVFELGSHKRLKLPGVRFITFTRGHLSAFMIVLSTLATATMFYKQWSDSWAISVTDVPGLKTLTEASGAAVVGNRVFVVGDETNQAVFQMTWNKDRYDTALKCELLDKDGQKFSPTPNDLESIVRAPDGQHLWLMTSHSNTEKGESKKARRLLLEVEVPAADAQTCQLKVTNQRRDLRKLMLAALTDYENFRVTVDDDADDPVPNCGDAPRKADTSGINPEIMQVEGMALNAAEDTVYFGLRAPLVTPKGTGGQHAVVLQARVDELFKDTLKFTALTLPLALDSHAYGIASIDRAPDGALLLLGTSADKSVTLAPVVCRLTPSNGALTTPHCHYLPRLKEPAPWARPESLVFSPNGKAVMFLDGDDRHYGELVIDRKYLEERAGLN